MKKGLLTAYLALACVCIVWGTTYLALRIGVTQFPPFLFSIFRFLLAGPLLIILTFAIGKVSWPGIKMLRDQAIGGLFMITLGISIVAYAEVYVSSGVAAIICSLMPVWTVLINVFISKDEKPNWLILLGLVTGLAGIVLIFGEHLAEFADSNYTTGIVAVVLANLCWAIGSIYVKKKNQQANPFLSAGFQMFFGGIFLIPLSLIFDHYDAVNWSDEVIFSLGYMIVIGSMAAYVCYAYAMKKLPMTIVSLYAYINPIVAVILGWLVLDESLNLRVTIAIVLTLAGIYMVNRGNQLRTELKAQLTE